jgi:hypothetical protein
MRDRQFAHIRFPLLWPAALLLLVCAAACREGTGIEELDPRALTPSDSIVFVCGHWYPASPPIAYGLFDVAWGPMTSSGQVGEEPTAAQLDSVRIVGGRIVHEFHIPMVRAILRPDGVVALRPSKAWGVPDVDQFPVEVSIGYISGVTDADLELVEELGGTVTHEYGHVHAVAAIVPDSAIPILRAQARVTHVSGFGHGCLDGAAR